MQPHTWMVPRPREEHHVLSLPYMQVARPPGLVLVQLTWQKCPSPPHGFYAVAWVLLLTADGLSVFVQVDSGGKGEHGAAGRGDRKPRWQWEPGQPRSSQIHELHSISCVLSRGLLPSKQRSVHPSTHPAQPRSGSGQTRHHDSGKCLPVPRCTPHPASSVSDAAHVLFV